MLKNKNLPVRFENDDPKTGNILLIPIINFAIDLGMNLEGQQILYFSMEHDCYCPIGIEAQIDDQETVSIDDLRTESKLKLYLKIEPPEQKKALEKGGESGGGSTAPANENLTQKIDLEELRANKAETY